MAFERYIPPRQKGPTPKATIRPSGLISFDKVAVATYKMDQASHLVLFFDPRRKLIGIKNTEDANRIGATEAVRRRNSISVKCPEFFERYGILIDDSRKFSVGFDPEAGMLTIDVTGLRRRRGRRPGTGQAAEQQAETE